MTNILERHDPPCLVLSSQVRLSPLPGEKTFPTGVIFFNDLPFFNFFLITEKGSFLSLTLECANSKRFGLSVKGISLTQEELGFDNFVGPMQTDLFSTIQTFCFLIPYRRITSDDNQVKPLYATCNAYVKGIDERVYPSISDALWKRQILNSVDGAFTDFVLNVRDKRFFAHRSVIQARCPLLFKKLKTNEQHEQQLDADPSKFKDFIKFLYTGHADATNIFSLKRLVESCEIKLLSDEDRGTTLDPVSRLDRAATKFIERGIVLKYSFKLSRLPNCEGVIFTKKSKDFFRFYAALQVVDIVPDRSSIMIKLSFFTRGNSRIYKVYNSFSGSKNPQQKHSMTAATCKSSFANSFNSTVNQNVYKCKFYVVVSEMENDSYFYEFKDNTCPMDLWQSALKGQTTDIQFHVRGNIFHAHRWILAARSSVFARMFSVDMVESRTGHVFVKDISPSIFKNLLFFIYTGEAKPTRCKQQLKEAADKYEITTLLHIFQSIEELRNA